MIPLKAGRPWCFGSNLPLIMMSRHGLKGIWSWRTKQLSRDLLSYFHHNLYKGTKQTLLKILHSCPIFGYLHFSDTVRFFAKVFGQKIGLQYCKIWIILIFNVLDFFHLVLNFATLHLWTRVQTWESFLKHGALPIRSVDYFPIRMKLLENYCSIQLETWL